MNSFFPEKIRPAFQPRSFVEKLGEGIQKAPLLFAAFGGILAIVLVDSGRLGSVAFLIFCGFLAVAVAIRRATPCWPSLLILSLVLVGYGWRHHLRLAEIGRFPFAVAMAEGRRVEIAGEGWISGSLRSGGRSVMTRLHLDRLTIGDQELELSHQVPCWIQQAPPGLRYGTRVRFTGRLLPLEGPSVPGGFDAKRFYFRQLGALAKLEITGADRFEQLEGEGGWAIVRLARRWRSELETRILLGIAEGRQDYAKLISAMALGAKENSPEELEAFFRSSGTMHLFAVSGLHVAVVTGLLVGLASILRIPRSRSIPFIIPLILFYALLTGLSPSAVRAALMATAFLSAYVLHEKPRLLNSLGFAALVLLLYEPQQLFWPGFQLSFLVIFFIALLAHPLSERFARPFLTDPFIPKRLVRPLRKKVDHLVGWIAAAFAVSVASWLGSAGLLTWHFQTLAPVGLIANLVMVPFAGWIISLAAFSLFASGVSLGWIAIMANRINVFLAMTLTSLAQYFSSLPGAEIHTGFQRSAVLTQPVLQVDVMGDRSDAAILLELRDKAGTPHRWMIDTGSRRTYQGRVLPLMRSRGINRIEALLLTHGDQGHLGAAASVIEQFRPKLLFESAMENRSPAYPEILQSATQHQVRRLALDRGSVLQLNGGATLRVLHPWSGEPGRLADDRALVFKLEYGRRSLLFTSDSGFETEQSLLARDADLRADVWVRGQHAESPAALPAFIEAISPRAIISSHAEFPLEERIPESLREWAKHRSIPLFEHGAAGVVTLRLANGRIQIEPFTQPEKNWAYP